MENVVERAIIFMDPEEQLLTPALLYPSILKNAEQNRQLSSKGFLQNPHSDKTALHTAEDMVIRRYLLQTGLDVKATAQCLGISTPTLYRKIRASAELSSLLKGKKRNTTKGPST